MVRRLIMLGVLCALPSGAAAQAFPGPPTSEQVAEVRAAIEAMKGQDRGPFLRIQWYCADGTVHVPPGTPCRERGGGVQHAAHSASAQRLAALGYGVGTILQSMDYTAFADSARAGYRLRELVLERYLVDVDDGWVMRRARYYRGALQAEDEEAQGQRFMARRLADGAWVRGNYFLAVRLAGVVPHVRLGGDRSVQRIRSLATEIAELDAGFMRTRIKIHSVPGRDDVATVAAYLARGGHAPAVRDKLRELHTGLEALYDPARALSTLAAYEARVGGALGAELAETRRILGQRDPSAALASLGRAAVAVRQAAEASTNGAVTLDLLDLQTSLQERAFVIAVELEGTPAVGGRLPSLDRIAVYADLAHGAGFLTGRERASLQSELSRLRQRGTITALEYKTALGYIGRSLDWARGTVRGTFSPVVDRYLPVEPKSAQFVDDALRGSVLLPLSQALDRLQADADLAMGSSHHVLGRDVGQGVRGLNPGVALRTLRVLHGHADDVDVGTIYVLPETPPELKPVAGVLTLDEGNLLSHVQLLARNLGIPNASLRPDLLPALSEADGREVFYAVTPLGRVLVKWPDQLEPRERALVDSDRPAEVQRHSLDTSRLDLTRWQPVPLSELRAEQSGVIVGPKAANLGQLAADFPGRVSRGVALPFGMFVRHADRRYGGSERTVLGELRAMYAQAGRMRSEGANAAEVNGFMMERLAWVREAIEGLEWVPELREAVVRGLGETLGGEVSRGVFVRSDTNVEDLPEFSGAGLNLTVAHQTTVEDVLASVKRVWTSPFSERAYLWRSQILEEQGDVYPSILLLESVASEKSGVLITSGLQEGGPEDITVVTAEGVGGAVDGEDAETVVVHPDGTTTVLTLAKSARKRALVPGGTRWVAASRPDTLLRPAELEQLLDVVATWKEKMAGTPDDSRIWDMEFGFLDGRLWLFQVRPFIRFRNSDTQAQLETLDAEVLENADRLLRLADPMEGR